MDAGLPFLRREDAHARENLPGGLLLEDVEGGHGVPGMGEAPALGLGLPFLTVAVALEADVLGVQDGPAQDGEEGDCVLLARGDLPLQFGPEAIEGLRHGGIDDGQGKGDGLTRPHGPEFEFVAREGEGARAIAVRGIPLQLGQVGQAEVQDALDAGIGHIAPGDGVQHGIELSAQEGAHDGRGSLVGPQAMIVARAGDGGPQEAAVAVDGLQGRRQEKQELQVLFRRAPGFQQVLALIGGQAPVHMLAAAIDPREGLLVEQAHQAMLLGHPL